MTLRPFKSIEDRHGVNEPGYEPPQDHPRASAQLAARGERLRATGDAASMAGRGLIGLGCLGFVLLAIAGVTVGALSGSGKGRTPSSTLTPEGGEAPAKASITPKEQETEANAALRVEENQKALERQKDPNEKLCIAANLSPADCKANREVAEATEAQMHGEGVGP